MKLIQTEDVEAAMATPDWILEDLVVPTLTMWVGAGGTGKSTSAVKLCRAIHQGAGVSMGKKLSVTGKTAWITAEIGGSQELYKRMGLYGVRPEDMYLGEMSDLTPTSIEMMKADNVKLLVVDHLTGIIEPGQSVNHASVVSAALGKFQPAVDAGIAVIILHHSNKYAEDVAAGSAQAVNGVRHVVALIGPPGPEQVWVITKSNVDGEAYDDSEPMVVAGSEYKNVRRMKSDTRKAAKAEAANLAWAEQFEFYRAECSGLSNIEAGKIMAGKFTGAAGTWTNHKIPQMKKKLAEAA